ncbi:MAG: SIS domain-containing protein [Chloroflexi bacterium]|nr:SIS domain-containing protein [Chloroflexota bacterium]
MSGFAEEIWEQPAALHNALETVGGRLAALAALRERLRAGDLTRVVMTGMGSSFSAMPPAMMFLLERGITVFGLDAAELLYYYPNALDKRTLAIVVSQSGASVEVRRIVEELPRPGALIALSNTPGSPLDRAGDVALYMGAGKEVTVSNKSYTCSLAALHLMARALVGDDIAPERARLARLADALQPELPRWFDQAQALVEWFAGARVIEFLGRGTALASAQTGALITKECAKFPTEAMSAGQFRHGPMELVTPELGVILFAGPERTRHLSVTLARDLTARGARVALIGGESQPDVLHIPLPEADEWTAPIAEIIPVQCFAAALAASRGVEVGKFYFSSKVTVVE